MQAVVLGIAEAKVVGDQRGIAVDGERQRLVAAARCGVDKVTGQQIAADIFDQHSNFVAAAVGKDQRTVSAGTAGNLLRQQRGDSRLAEANPANGKFEFVAGIEVPHRIGVVGGGVIALEDEGVVAAHAEQVVGAGAAIESVVARAISGEQAAAVLGVNVFQPHRAAQVGEHGVDVAGCAQGVSAGAAGCASDGIHASVHAALATRRAHSCATTATTGRTLSRSGATDAAA